MLKIAQQLLIFRHPVLPKDASADTLRYIKDQQKQIDVFVKQVSALITPLVKTTDPKGVGSQ